MQIDHCTIGAITTYANEGKSGDRLRFKLLLLFVSDSHTTTVTILRLDASYIQCRVAACKQTCSLALLHSIFFMCGIVLVHSPLSTKALLMFVVMTEKSEQTPLSIIFNVTLAMRILFTSNTRAI